ncbi:MAG: leucine-rich repeat domain-containing protein [Clostridia bacterium]|nr:leucine-rich repeat domain-containing protein [Clostridia bacterium]
MQTIDRDGCIYQIHENGEAVLTECHAGMPMLTLPAQVDGHPVTGVEYDAFDHAGSVEAFRVETGHPAFSVVYGVLFDQNGERLIRYPRHRDGAEYIVPEGTRAVETGAFAGAEYLKRVIVPEGVTVIGTRAFADCPVLSSVSIPASVTEFGHEVFSGCAEFSDLRIPSSHPFLRREGPFLVNRRDSMLLLCLPGACEAQMVAPEGIKTVDEYAFYGCDRLQKIHFHHGLRVLGRYAFYHCESIHVVELPEGLRTIGTRAFSGCSQMRSLYIPDSVTSIEYKAFNHCDRLVLQVNKGSYADRYCRQFGFPCRHRMKWPWQ